MPRQLLLAIAMFVFKIGAAGAGTLAVVGFNVDSDDASDDFIAAQLAKSAGIDVWGLTEVWDKRDWPETMRLGAEAGAGAAYLSILGTTGGDERSMILFRGDRLELLAQEEITEAQASDREAAPLVARLRLVDGPEFLFMVVNLSDQDSRRRKQIAALAAWANRQALPVVAIGSFFFELDVDRPVDPDLDSLLATTGWVWVQPDSDVGTWCGDRGRITDNVLVGGGATGWEGSAEVMYPQSNYCPDSVRSSDHRPLLARFAFGDEALPEVSIPERQVRPFLPGGVKVISGDDAGQADENSAPPVSQSEYDALKRRVQELESRPAPSPPPAPATLPAAEPAADRAPVSVPKSAPAPAAPDALDAPDAPVVVEESIDTVPAAPTPPAISAPADPYQELLKRIEELEAEVKRLRESETNATQ
jgi:hypothetical protein